MTGMNIVVCASTACADFKPRFLFRYKAGQARGVVETRCPTCRALNVVTLNSTGAIVHAFGARTRGGRNGAS